jgi:hypothetical protein
MSIVEKNFSNIDPALIPDEQEFVRCNFSRKQPDTSGPEAVGVRLFPGNDAPRIFIDCNLMNCEPPPGSILVRCNTWIVTTGELAHTEELTIDGVVEHSIQYHDRTVHAKYVDGNYDRTGYPQTMPEDY